MRETIAMKKKLFFLCLVSCLAMAAACGRQEPPPGTREDASLGQEQGSLETQEPEEREEADNSASQPMAPVPESEAGDVEHYESVPYRLYPTSEGAWVGDVMPMADEDGLQLYYLYDTDHNGMGYHPIHKFSTTNFYEYRDDGLMVPFGASGDEPDLAIGTGCVVKDRDGRYHCFYTGHNDSFHEKGLDRECVMHAVSEDNVNWTKIPEDTFYAAENYSGDDFRDPYIFWNEEEQCYWLLIAAREESLGGVVARYTSTDLSAWTLCDPLYAPEKQYMLECPDLFRMGDHYYLFYSWDMVTYYAMADSAYGPFTEPGNNVLDGTGFCFYAAKTAEYAGRRYLCGWVGRKPEPKDTGNYNWAGSLLVHELVQKEDGTLGVKEPSGLAEYFTQEKTPALMGTSGNVETEADAYRLSAGSDEIALAQFGMREPTMLLECTVSLGRDGYAGFAFGMGEEYGKYTGLVLDAKNQSIHYEGCVLSRIPYVEPVIYTDFQFEPDKEYHVKLVMENEIVVLYIDDTKALSNRIYKSVDGANWGIFANDTDAVFRDIIVKSPAAP